MNRKEANKIIEKHSAAFGALPREAIEAIEYLINAEPQKMCFDGMTNGEVIDLLFPGADIYHNRDFTLREMIFPDEWWDAPYKAEKGEKRNCNNCKYGYQSSVCQKPTAEICGNDFSQWMPYKAESEGSNAVSN